MLNIDGLDISVSRGDTGTITITLTGDVPADGTTALFTVRKSVDMTDSAVLEKELTVSSGQVVIDLSSSDTDIPWFAYCWDLRLIYENGDVFTPFAPAVFEVCEVVGDV